MTSWMGRGGVLLAAALGCIGCAHAVEGAGAPDSPAHPSNPGLPGAPSSLERELAQRLAAVEKALAQASAEARGELVAERLVLVVALAELHASPEAASASADQLLEAARGAIARARERAAGGDDRTRGGDAVAEDEAREKELAEEYQRRAQQQAQIETRRDEIARMLQEKSRAQLLDYGKKGGCAPGDPLCGDDDDEPAPERPREDEPKGDEPKKSDKSSHRPGPVAAARVAYEPTPTGVMAEIRRHFGRVSACIGPELRQQELQLRVVVLLDEQGLLREPRVEGAGLDAVTRDCVAEVFRTMRVQDYAGGSRVLSVPLWLAAER